MSRPELHQFATADELAASAAEQWLDQLAGIPGDRPSFVALSGGRIAARFFSAAAARAQAQPGVLDRVHFFWGDERCVPPDDAESNFALAQELLLKPLRVAPDRVHRIRGELVKDDAAREAELEIGRIVPSNGGQPRLDLVFLGMGEDGHVASLFPGDREPDSPRVYRGVIGPKPPPARVTIGYGALVTASRVWVLASGKGKEEALSRSLEPGEKTPLGRVLRLRQEETRILTDISLNAVTAD